MKKFRAIPFDSLFFKIDGAVQKIHQSIFNRIPLNSLTPDF